ncbi:hypothetical protein SNE40_021283 [Patella caerulea]|uniref:BED-type domain-containing protein n=1 Tax=Patella caerulea TaxID=87958 RepID=A0AAN8IWG9_PATCE
MADPDDLVEVEGTTSDIVPKRNCTSRIWLYFGFGINDTNQNKVLCRSCKRNVAAKNGNTSNLYAHLKVNHPIHYSQLQQKIRTNPKKTTNATSGNKTPQKNMCKGAGSDSNSTTSIQSNVQNTHQSSILSSMTYEKTSKRWVTLTNAITQCLAKDTLPFYTVEKSGFIKMLKTFDSRYNLPGRKYFSTAIPKLYQTVRDQVMEEVSEATYFAGTTDLWSSRTMEPYMSYTAHFIDRDWNLASKHLQTVFFPDDHTGENLAAGLKVYSVLDIGFIWL